MRNQRPPAQGDLLSYRYQKDLVDSKEAALDSQLFFSRSETCHLQFQVCIYFQLLSGEHSLPDQNLWLHCLLGTVCWQGLLSSPHLLEASRSSETLWRARKKLWVDSWSGQWQPFLPLAVALLKVSLSKCAQLDRLNHTWNTHLWVSKWPHRYIVCNS